MVPQTRTIVADDEEVEQMTARVDAARLMTLCWKLKVDLCFSVAVFIEPEL